MNIIQAVDIFKTEDGKNIQLDIFRSNGQVLLQVYRLSDVKEWGLIDTSNEEGYLIELTFNKSKTSNRNNKERFMFSEYKEKFHRFDKIPEDSYFYFVPKQIDSTEFSNLIMKLIKDVYDDVEEVTFSVNEY
ncbi:MAG: hypothetical protein ACOCWM_04535 [Cyclobacteriaceae bacterium]